jgi:hypothetical protein
MNRREFISTAGVAAVVPAVPAGTLKEYAQALWDKPRQDF